MCSSDLMSADRNAQTPPGHPDAQVRVDQTNKLAGVQQPKYPAPVVPEAAVDGVPVAVDAEAATVADDVPAPPIPDGEVVPDAGTSENG